MRLVAVCVAVPAGAEFEVQLGVALHDTSRSSERQWTIAGGGSDAYDLCARSVAVRAGVVSPLRSATCSADIVPVGNVARGPACDHYSRPDQKQGLCFLLKPEAASELGKVSQSLLSALDTS